ncbi:hypothetical protein B6U81_01325 [Thermoplasmatales archaeon ex4484_30]|nr:MAG: hypothetical protein B6U81_01325 [Thermoplasmatales archaeon ex4484_30]
MGKTTLRGIKIKVGQNKKFYNSNAAFTTYGNGAYAFNFLFFLLSIHPHSQILYQTTIYLH